MDVSENSRIAERRLGAAGYFLRMAANPIEIQKALKGVDYPASKGDLVRRAEDNGGDDDVVSAIGALPEQQYDAPSDVSKALGDQD